MFEPDSETRRTSRSNHRCLVKSWRHRSGLLSGFWYDSRTPPCQLTFGTWRVNDYDLTIQHNEAVELVGEHLGMIRTRTDPFFDGTRGQQLVKRDGEGLLVEIMDVLSLSILQRLKLQEGLFRAEVTDWRAVVDCVLIDTDYQGEVFNVRLADIPERKQDLVQGRYQLPLPAAGARVAVKIIDMLGEELLIERAP